MTKLVICVIIVGLCALIGYGISISYTQRKKFFFELSNFLNSIKVDIQFSSKKLDLIITNSLNIYMQKDFVRILKNYQKTLTVGRIEKGSIFDQINILTDQEKETIFQFLLKLGKTNSDSQIESINKTHSVCMGYYEYAKDESKKYGSLYIKLGVIVGSFIAIIIA